ncbi:MAG: DUF1579 family protein [Planctomycetes bacterium]|nr:DUF1579 family protein [Planctomycetota bacterium]
MRTVLPSVLVLALCACQSTSSKARTSPPAVRAPEPELQQQVSAQEAASAPGPMHKKLEPMVGEWQTTLTRLAPDGSEVPGGGGVTRITELFGGRYQRWDSALEIGGKARELTGWLGYDRNALEYQLSMITSFSSGMAIYRGHGDLAKEGILFVYDQIDPTTGTHLSSRNRVKLLTHDHFVIEDVDEDLRVHARSHYRRVNAAVK